jgi:hypothetical protein
MSITYGHLHGLLTEEGVTCVQRHDILPYVVIMYKYCLANAISHEHNAELTLSAVWHQAQKRLLHRYVLVFI